MQTLTITRPDGVVENFETNDVKVYSDIAKYLSEANISGKYDICYSVYSALFQLINKGGTFFIRQEYSNIPYVDNGTLPTVYLVMVNPEYNNYKFYKLEDAGDQVLATYGRIGASSNEMFGERTHYYPKDMYYVKLMEKLAKGYKDMTDIYCRTNVPCETLTENNKTENESDNSASALLYNILVKYARHRVKETCISSVVTEKMVQVAQELLDQLYSIDTSNSDTKVVVSEFNNTLLELLCVSPRRVSQVEDLLATNIKDFPRILERESDLLNAMKVVIEKGDSSGKKSYNDFEKYKIKIHFATEKQKEEVLRHLSNELKGKVKNIYRVIHPEHKARFNKYLKDNNIKKVKQLWHGSRNENWLSIIDNGLLLNPNAIITGKMFGNGIYFAPSSMKSWGYTSAYNSYWARGSSDTCFMGLYAVAYGKPLDVSCAHYYDKRQLKTQNADCVHAHAGIALRNDEIIFYDEAAILLNYIVEFKS